MFSDMIVTNRDSQLKMSIALIRQYRGSLLVNMTLIVVYNYIYDLS